MNTTKQNQSSVTDQSFKPLALSQTQSTEPVGRTVHIELEEPGKYPEESIEDAIEKSLELCQDAGAEILFEVSGFDDFRWEYDPKRNAFTEYRNQQGVGFSEHSFHSHTGFRKRLESLLWDNNETNSGLFRVGTGLSTMR